MFGIVHEFGLSKDHLALVGAIAVEWSAVEFKLQSLLSTLIGKDYALGLSATSNMGYKSIVATMRTLAGSAQASIPTFNSQIVALLDEAERLQILRNAVVHASWDSVSADGGMNAQVARFKGKLKNYVEMWSREQLEQIAPIAASYYPPSTSSCRFTSCRRKSTNSSLGKHRSEHCPCGSLRRFRLAVPKSKLFCTSF